MLVRCSTICPPISLTGSNAQDVCVNSAFHPIATDRSGAILEVTSAGSLSGAGCTLELLCAARERLHHQFRWSS
jgi:hypothetical protein